MVSGEKSKRLQQNGGEATKNGNGRSHSNGSLNRNSRAAHNGNGHAMKRHESTATTLSLSPTALAITVVSTLLFAFFAGRMSRPYFMMRAMDPGIEGEPETKGKVVGPISVYSFQDFDKEICTKEEKENSNETKESTCSIYAASTQREHMPSEEVSSTGQHLVVDMEGVEQELLNSDERLSQAIIETALEANMMLRSYHCHSLTPMGVSCIGLLGRGHVAFHTWPEEGVITLDFFAWSLKDVSIQRYLNVVVEKFGVARDPKIPTGVVWSQKRRGFHETDPPTDADFEVAEPGWLFKEQVVSIETPFQLVEIYRGINTRYSLDVTKKVFLNGDMQSTLSGEAAYHEALVHPAMFAHDDPERVAIIGGGEGATLREVLKHSTVQNVIMIDIDEKMIEISREYLPEWSDCSGFGGAANCFDEPRANVYTEDALAWFIDRFYTTDDSGETANSKGLGNADPMDVIIMDALDPQHHAEFCDTLYNNNVFLEALYRALSESGVLVMELGEAPGGSDAPEELTIHHNRANIIKDLEEVGFESAHVYDESHCDFSGPWTFLVAFKNSESRLNWYSNEAEIELSVSQRSLPSKDGSPFLHFDSATMFSYQTPPKVFEDVFCRQEPTPKSCNLLRGGFDLYTPNVPTESLEVKASMTGYHAGRGVFTNVDIAKDSYLGLEKSADAVEFPPSTHELIDDLNELDQCRALGVFPYYMYGYGFESDTRGGSETSVDSSILTFANHGCNGTFNIGWLPYGQTNLTEFTADIAEMPLHDFERHASLYDPVIDRNRRHLNSGGDAALRDIQAGEELLDNYLSMTSSKDNLENDVRDIRSQCGGQGVGTVSKYEDEKRG